MKGGRLVRLRELIRKEFLQIRRDPRLMRIILVAPVIQLIVFGYAVSTDVRRTAMFLVDHDNSQVSRELVDALTASGYFRIVGTSQRPADMVNALDHADALAGMEIPRGFAMEWKEPALDGTPSARSATAPVSNCFPGPLGTSSFIRPQLRVEQAACHSGLRRATSHSRQSKRARGSNAPAVPRDPDTEDKSVADCRLYMGSPHWAPRFSSK